MVTATFHCNHNKCPRCGKCLRYQVALDISQKLPYYTTVNPQHNSRE
ncbi:DUF6078 family protein [Bacteroides acidifaciens]